MNYEKRYKEILAKARTFYKKWDGVDAYNSSLAISELKEIFPELQDSENEDTRQSLIDYLRERQSCESYGQYVLRYDRWITWLEKQGQGEQRIAWSEEDEYLLDETTRHLEELIRIDKAKHCGVDVQYYQRDIDWLKSIKERVQPKQGEPKDYNSIDPHFGKPIDKIEPKKFKVGDFIVNDYCKGKIIELTNDAYLLDTGQGIPFSCEHNIHLWTCQDAKDGDVLCTYECDEPKIVFVLKGTPKKHYALSYYCYYNIMYPYFEPDSKTGCLAPNEEDVKPATEEQRNLLFQKMKESGYEWMPTKRNH